VQRRLGPAAQVAEPGAIAPTIDLYPASRSWAVNAAGQTRRPVTVTGPIRPHRAGRGPRASVKANNITVRYCAGPYVASDIRATRDRCAFLIMAALVCLDDRPRGAFLITEQCPTLSRVPVMRLVVTRRVAVENDSGSGNFGDCPSGGYGWCGPPICMWAVAIGRAQGCAIRRG
jgi:hypothetical protein